MGEPELIRDTIGITMPVPLLQPYLAERVYATAMGGKIVSAILQRKNRNYEWEDVGQLEVSEDGTVINL